MKQYGSNQQINKVHFLKDEIKTDCENANQIRTLEPLSRDYGERASTLSTYKITFATSRNLFSLYASYEGMQVKDWLEFCRISSKRLYME